MAIATDTDGQEHPLLRVTRGREDVTVVVTRLELDILISAVECATYESPERFVTLLENLKKLRSDAFK